MALISPGINLNAQTNLFNDASSQYSKLTEDALNAQYKNMLLQAQLENQLVPVLADNWTNKYNTMMDASLGLQNKYLQPSLDLQGKFSSGLSGIYKGAYNDLYGNMSGGVNQSYGTAESAFGRVGNEVTRQEAELARTQGELGSQLSNKEIQFAQQAARAAAQGRGVQLGQKGSNLEILNTYNLGQIRQKQRQDAYIQQQAAAAQALGLYNQAMGNVNNAEGNRNQLAGLAAQMAGQVYSESNKANLYSQLGYASNAVSGLTPNMLTPESQMMSDLQKQINQNRNMASARAATGAGTATIGNKPKSNNFNNQYVNGNPALGLVGAQSIFGKPVQQLYGPGGATAAQLPAGFVKASDFSNTVNNLVSNKYSNTLSPSYSYGGISSFTNPSYNDYGLSDFNSQYNNAISTDMSSYFDWL